jgi:hypothetical protein
MIPRTLRPSTPSAFNCEKERSHGLLALGSGKTGPGAGEPARALSPL